MGDLDPKAQGALRNSAQIWVKQEVLKGRIVHTKKWNDQEGVGEAGGVHHFALLVRVRRAKECTNFRDGGFGVDVL